MALPDSSRLDRNPGKLLTGRFREIGLTREYIRGMTGRGDDLRTPLVASRAALFSDEAAAVGLRLFLCGESLSREAAAACLGEDLLQSARDCGLLAEAGPDGVAAPFHLRTAGDLYLFSDYLGAERDAVMGAGETTAVLFRAARPLQRVGSTLDLGCGAGTLALLLAARADHVIGTDINPRAIALARLNASVNGIANAEFRCGDVWEAVERDVFDLIVSQPPYYPKPAVRGAAEQVFLHGGERGDELSRRIVEEIPWHLAPSGRAIVFTSWPEETGPPAVEGMEILELTTDRREVHGTRQSMNVIEFADDGRGWHAVFEAAADRWGSVDWHEIDRMLAAERLLRGPRSSLLSAALRLPEGAVPFQEGAHMVLQFAPGYRLAMAALDDRTWEVISALDAAPDVQAGIDALASRSDALVVVERALRRGLLIPGPGA